MLEEYVEVVIICRMKLYGVDKKKEEEDIVCRIRRKMKF